MLQRGCKAGHSKGSHSPGRGKWLKGLQTGLTNYGFVWPGPALAHDAGGEPKCTYCMSAESIMVPLQLPVRNRHAGYACSGHSIGC